jgi:hypothetical protein
MRHCTTICALLLSCSDYSFTEADDPPKADTGPGDSEAPAAPDILLGPPSWDFGTLDTGDSAELSVSIGNTGGATLAVHDVLYEASSAELSLDRLVGSNGGLPWLIAPGDSLTVTVGYAPVDDGVDTGTISVISTDPDEPTVQATQRGTGRSFEDFYTGWYVYDDGIPYETTSNPSHVVDHHGDADLYWYEPSGAHGLIDSPDPDADFAVMRQYVLDHAGHPVVPSGPFSYDAASSLATFEWATFTYFMCDFYLDPSDDPSLYEISSGTVDDGIQVMVNGEILGRLTLGDAGSWPLDNARAGEVNTLIIILVDDSAVNKYIHDLAFYRDGVMVTG